MRLFNDYGTIQIECAAILANLVSNERNREQILIEGCLNLILDNMRKFIGQPVVQVEMCAALSNMALFETHAKIIVAAKGLDLILDLLERYAAQHADLYVHLFHTLSNVAKHAQSQVDSSKLIQSVFKAMQYHENRVETIVARNNAVGSLAFASAFKCF
jgi:hypothetical protein